MANALYDKGRKAFLDADIDWLVDTIKVVLVDLATYTLNISGHEFLADISVAARTAISPALTTKTSLAGVADANDVTFTAVTGPTSEALVIFVDTGAEGTSRLIAFIDTASGLPITPNGSDIVLVWDNGANKIFKL